jgi:hypothetical protein
VIDLQNEIRGKLQQAAKDIPADANEAMDRLERNPPVFSAVSAIESIAKVPLSATSEELHTALERVCSYNEKER